MGTGCFFSQCKRLPRFARKDILQVGLMNQAPTLNQAPAVRKRGQAAFLLINGAGKKGNCPLFPRKIFLTLIIHHSPA
jgi:hypothetical protein